MRYSYFYEVLVIFSAIFLVAHRGFSFQHGESESRAVANSDMSEGIVFSCDGKKAGDISAIKQRMEEMLEKEFKWNKSVYEINEKIEGGVSRLQFRLKNKSQNTLDLHTRPELKIKDVKETWVSGSHTEYTKMVVSVNEITAAMMTRGRVSEFKGESCDFNHFLDHVMMRQEISRWATRFNAEFPYRNWNADRTGKVPRFNSDYWDKGYLVKKGESVIDAIDDEFNGNFVYEMGCTMAVKSILMQGIFKHLGKDEKTRKLIEEIATNDPYQDSALPSEKKSGDSKYLTRQNNVPALHWIPGDWGYLVNRDAKSAKTVQGAEGHNMPYIGGGVFAHYYNSFGNHASIEKNIDKMQAWPFEAEYKEQADKLAGKAWEKWQDEHDAHEGQMHWSLMKWAEKKKEMSDEDYKKLINEAKTNSEDRDGKPTAKGMIEPTRDYPKIFSKTVSNDKRYSELLKKQGTTPHEEQVQVAKAEEKPKSEQKVVEKEVADEKEAVKLIKGSDYKKKKKGYEYLASHAPTVELQKTLIADLKHRPKSGEEEKREVVELSLKIVESQLEKFQKAEKEQLKKELKELTEIPVEQGQRASHIKEHAKELLEKLERKEEPESKNVVAAPLKEASPPKSNTSTVGGGAPISTSATGERPSVPSSGNSNLKLRVSTGDANQIVVATSRVVGVLLNKSGEELRHRLQSHGLTSSEYFKQFDDFLAQATEFSNRPKDAQNKITVSRNEWDQFNKRSEFIKSLEQPVPQHGGILRKLDEPRESKPSNEVLEGVASQIQFEERLKEPLLKTLRQYNPSQSTSENDQKMFEALYLIGKNLKEFNHPTRGNTIAPVANLVAEKSKNTKLAEKGREVLAQIHNSEFITNYSEPKSRNEFPQYMDRLTSIPFMYQYLNKNPSVVTEADTANAETIITKYRAASSEEMKDATHSALIFLSNSFDKIPKEQIGSMENRLRLNELAQQSTYSDIRSAAQTLEGKFVAVRNQIQAEAQARLQAEAQASRRAEEQARQQAELQRQATVLQREYEEAKRLERQQAEFQRQQTEQQKANAQRTARLNELRRQEDSLVKEGWRLYQVQVQTSNSAVRSRSISQYNDYAAENQQAHRDQKRVLRELENVRQQIRNLGY